MAFSLRWKALDQAAGASGRAQDEVFGAVATHDGGSRGVARTRATTTGESGIDLDYAFWSSVKGHRSGRFELRRVTTQSSDPQVQFVGVDDEGNEVQGLFIGDYTGLALGTDGVLHPELDRLPRQPGHHDSESGRLQCSVRDRLVDLGRVTSFPGSSPPAGLAVPTAANALVVGRLRLIGCRDAPTARGPVMFPGCRSTCTSFRRLSARASDLPMSGWWEVGGQGVGHGADRI